SAPPEKPAPPPPSTATSAPCGPAPPPSPHYSPPTPTKSGDCGATHPTGNPPPPPPSPPPAPRSSPNAGAASPAKTPVPTNTKPTHWPPLASPPRTHPSRHPRPWYLNSEMSCTTRKACLYTRGSTWATQSTQPSTPCIRLVRTTLSTRRQLTNQLWEAPTRRAAGSPTPNRCTTSRDLVVSPGIDSYKMRLLRAG